MAYVFAPTENCEKRDERNFRIIIDYIGSKQTGIGSYTAKGLRYIKEQLGCSNTTIKFLYKSSLKVLNHDFEQYGVYVYRYNEYCRGILSILCEYLSQYTEDKNMMNKENPSYIQLNNHMTKSQKFDWLFSNQYRAIEWVEKNNYKNQHEKANEIIFSLDCLK